MVQKQVALASKLVPSILVGSSSPMASTELHNLTEAFPDMPSPNCFSAEYDRWFCKWRRSAEATNVTDFTTAYIAADVDLFPNLHTVLKVCATRPSSTAGNERSFSSLKRLKTYLQGRNYRPCRPRNAVGPECKGAQN